MELFKCVAFDFPVTSPFLCNNAYINKMGLSPSIFIPGPSEVSCVVHSWDLVCKLLFTNLLLPLNLCVRMFDQLRANICEASRVRSKDAWLARS